MRKAKKYWLLFLKTSEDWKKSIASMDYPSSEVQSWYKSRNGYDSLIHHIWFLEDNFPKVLVYLSIHRKRIGGKRKNMIRVLLFIVFGVAKFMVVLTKIELSNKLKKTPKIYFLVAISKWNWIYHQRLLLWNWMENGSWLIQTLVTTNSHQSLLWVLNLLK